MKKKNFYLALLLMFVSSTAHAYDFKEGIFYYNILTTNTVEVTYKNTSYNSYLDTTINIPATVTHGGTTYNVTKLGYGCFNLCANIKHVTVPQGVTELVHSAFRNCSNLRDISLPNSLITIGKNCFWGCVQLKNITIPNSVNSIAESAFQRCHRLQTVVLSTALTTIQKHTFDSCTSLTTINFPNGLVSIGDSAFKKCYSLQSVTLPNSIRSIGAWGFGACQNLRSINLPNGLQRIGKYGFYCCKELTSISIPSSMTCIDTMTFQSCFKLNSVTIPSTITILKDGAFQSCYALTSINIPNSVITMDHQVFYNDTSLTNISLSNNLTYIGNNAFFGCKKLTNITLPNSVTILGYHVFEGCIGLSNVTLSNQLYRMYDWAFKNCTGLHKIYIPESVRIIAKESFLGCTSLDSVIFEAATNPGFGSNVFSQVPQSCVYMVPCGKSQAYSTASGVSISNFSEYYNYELTAVSFDNAKGSVTITQNPNCTTPAILLAVPSAHCHFENWSDGSTSSQLTVSVTQDMTITAYFDYDSHQVTAVANDVNMGSVQGSGSYSYGDSITLSAVPNNHYHFVGWSNGLTTPTIRIKVTGDISIVANFAVNTHSITVTSDNPAMGSVSGSGTYNYGTNATLVATPNVGCKFVRWSNGSTNSTINVYVDKDSTFTAFFTDGYVVSASSSNIDYGTVTGGGAYQYGDTAFVSAVAYDHYKFVNWNNGSTAKNLQFVVTKDTSLIANFEPMKYNVVANANYANAGVVTGTGQYDYLATATVTATPNEGYQFVSWSNGETSSTLFVEVVSDTVLTANFESTQSGVENTTTTDIKVACDENRVIVQGAIGLDIMCYDVAGKLIAKINDAKEVETLQIHIAGVYFVKISNLKPLRVIVK